MAGRSDTVVKAHYSRGGQAALKLAKEHLRYAVHRANEQGQRQYREVWDRASAFEIRRDESLYAIYESRN